MSVPLDGHIQALPQSLTLRPLASLSVALITIFLILTQMKICMSKTFHILLRIL